MSVIHIKIPQALADREMWGEFYFAYSLKKSLAARGLRARVLFREELHARVDCEIVLLGLGMHEYEPLPGGTSIAWLISHPDTNDLAVLRRYTRAFVSSRHLAREWSLPYLGQCFDRDVHFPPPADGDRGRPLDVVFVGNARAGDRARPLEVVFVGNARAGDRTDLIRTLSAALPGVHVWGHGHPPGVRAHGPLSWFDTGRVFRSARIVVNHNTAFARSQGVANDRLFAAMACGAFVLSDDVLGIGELVPELVIFRTPDEAVALAERYLPDLEGRADVARRCLERTVGEHFDDRAARLIDAIHAVDANRGTAP